jgi:hypothetical protein
MPIQETRTLPAPFIESLGKGYATDLTAIAQKPLATQQFQPKVAGQDVLQQQAASLAGTGLGAYEPYLTGAGGAGYAPGATAMGEAAYGTLGGVSPYISAAGTGLAGAGTALGTAGTQLTGAGTAMAGVPGYLTGAAGLTGPGAGAGAGTISDYMSPYQAQVIQTTLDEYDRQSQIGQQGILDRATGIGALGAGRTGVQMAEYQTGSDRNRALLQAGLQQQGFTQAQQARQQDLANQMGLAGAQQQYGAGLAGLAGQRGALAGQEAAFAGQQLGLGQAQTGLAQAQQQLGGYQSGLASLAPSLVQQRIGTLGQVGAMQQAQEQAELDAQREANRMAAYEPWERMQAYGTGVTGIMGGYPGQYQWSNVPNPTPLQTALGVGATMGGIYGNIRAQAPTIQQSFR